MHDTDGRLICTSTSGRGNGWAMTPNGGTLFAPKLRSLLQECSFEPGKYRLTLTLRVSKGSGSRSKMLSAQSNWFEVRE
jgi:hypothetical protein